MKQPQRVGAILISSFCFVIIVARVAWPKLNLDDKTVLLVAIAVLPWLILFFKKLKFGDVDIEATGKAQGTAAPISPIDEPNKPLHFSLGLDKDQMSSSAKKILATLWRYQKQSFGNDYSKRWTFLISPTSFDYSNYLKGLSELVSRALVTVQSENHQILLTNEGIRFMEQNADLQGYSEFYVF